MRRVRYAGKDAPASARGHKLLESVAHRPMANSPDKRECLGRILTRQADPSTGEPDDRAYS